MAKVRKRIGKKGTTWMIDYRDPLGKRVRVSFKKKKEAEAELYKRGSLIAEKRYLDVKKEYKTTLGEWIKEYKKVFPHPSKKTYCENFKEYFGEDTMLSQITYFDLLKYRNYLKQKITPHGKIRKDSTINREMSCLHQLFKTAISAKEIEKNPFSEGDPLWIKENNNRLRFLKEDEIQKLVDACPRYLRDIVECAIYTGMRKGEILTLKWDQIRDGFIYLKAKDTKTKEPRQIPINNPLETLFKNIRQEHGLKSKYVFLYDGDVIETKTGKKRKGKTEPRRITCLKHSFKSALKRANIEDFRFHDLRHTFASQLIMKGASLKDVQDLLGHKTMAMTLRYAHLTQEHKRKAVNLLDGLTNGHKMGTNSFSEKSMK